jgi:hypothetical protein
MHLLRRAVVSCGLVVGTLTLSSVASAQFISTVDYSDSFTFEAHGGVAGRANGVLGPANVGAYAVEFSGSNPPRTWRPQNTFSFNDVAGSFGAGPQVLGSSKGNPGAATGMAQAGNNLFLPNSLTVFFRRTSISGPSPTPRT